MTEEEARDRAMFRRMAADLARLRLTVAKVREIYAVVRAQGDAPLGDEALIGAANSACRVIADAIEDALIDADYEAAATEEVG